MTMREKMARAMCRRENVDPDAMGYGQGAIMQKDKPYRLWEARLHLVDAALDALMEPTDEMCRIAGEWGHGDAGKQAAETLSKNAFIMMIKSAKESK